MPQIETTTAGGEEVKTNGEAAIAAGETTTETKVEGDEKVIAAGEPVVVTTTTETKEDNDEPQVKSRKTTKDFIIQRQQHKIEKLKKDGEGKTGTESEEEEEPIDPDDKKVIERVLREQGATMLNEALEPILSKQVEQEDESELQAFLNDPENVDFKPYESRVRKFMAHPSRRELPIRSIFYEVAGDDLIKIGADRERRAREEAAETTAGGGTTRTESDGKVDWSALSPEEFRKEKAKALEPQNRS